MKVWLFFAVGWWLLGAGLSAQLSFGHDQVRDSATIDQRSTVAVFPFTNVGESTVEILEVRSSCGCTVAELPQRVYAPGESGEIKAEFTYGDRSGRQQKQLTVRTDEGQTYRLGIMVEIPQLWTLSPRLLYWRAGQMGPLSTVLTLEHGAPGEVVEAKALFDAFQVQVEEVEPGRSFRLTATPRAVATRTDDSLRVTLRDAEGREHLAKVYLRRER